MEEHRVDLIEKFLARVEPNWRDIARGKVPARRPAGGTEFAPAPGAAHPDMIVDEEQTKRDRIALGLDVPEAGANDNGGDDSAERADLLEKLARYRGVDGYNVPDDDATTDQLRAALAACQQREAANPTQ